MEGSSSLAERRNSREAMHKQSPNTPRATLMSMTRGAFCHCHRHFGCHWGRNPMPLLPESPNYDFPPRLSTPVGRRLYFQRWCFLGPYPIPLVSLSLHPPRPINPYHYHQSRHHFLNIKTARLENYHGWHNANTMLYEPLTFTTIPFLLKICPREPIKIIITYRSNSSWASFIAITAEKSPKGHSVVVTESGNNSYTEYSAEPNKRLSVKYWSHTSPPLIF